jgi:inner membrane transporter RhtA
MVSLLPATATVVGLVVLAQVPKPQEVIGVSLVIAGVAVHREPDGVHTGAVEEYRRSRLRKLRRREA